MESLGSDEVSPPNSRKYFVGNDDVKAGNGRRRYGYCDVTMAWGRTRVLTSVTRRATSSGSIPGFDLRLIAGDQRSSQY